MEKQKEKKNMTFGAHALLACQANAAEPKERGAGLRSIVGTSKSYDADCVGFYFVKRETVAV